MFRYIVALFVSLFVMGCAPTWIKPQRIFTERYSGKIFVCVDLPDERIQDAISAVEEWDRSLRQWKHIVPVVGLNETCHKRVYEGIVPPLSMPKAMAWVKLGGTDIQLRVGHYEHDTRGVLLHELGHAFGAQHVPGTLMDETWHKDAFTCPDIVTVAQVAAWNRVSIDLLSWCDP